MVPRNKNDRIHRMYIFVVMLLVYYISLFTCISIITDKSHIRLIAVQFNHVDKLIVGAPCNVGKISVGRIPGIQIYCVSCLGIEYANGYLMTGFSCHWILD